MILWLYRFLSTLLHPLIPLLLRKRLARGKEDAPRIHERLGITSTPRPEGTIIWVHAASMGEVNSVLPLITRITEHFPTLHIVLTTVTVTSAAYVKDKLPQRVIHQFVPVDTPQATALFLSHWRPRMVCLVDSEFWPNMLMMSKKAGCLLVLLNARISQRSTSRWRYASNTIHTMLNCFSLILAKSTEDALRLKQLGATHVRECGNLKFSAPALSVDHDELSRIQHAIGDRPVWLAASTHAGEERMMCDAHRALQQNFPNLLTIIVPRHSVRGASIATELQTSVPTQTIHLRSANETITPSTSLYIADTMGELGLWYRAASIVVIGGSFVAHGGQNPFEAALLDAAIICGTHMHNFTEFCEPLQQSDALITVHSVDELTSTLRQLLSDAPRVKAIGLRAQHVVQARQDALDNVWRELQPLIAEAL